MWELLAGSILAYFEIIKGQRVKKKKYNFIFQSLGLILIGHSIIFFNDKNSQNLLEEIIKTNNMLVLKSTLRDILN